MYQPTDEELKELLLFVEERIKYNKRMNYYTDTDSIRSRGNDVIVSCMHKYDGRGEFTKYAKTSLAHITVDAFRDRRKGVDTVSLNEFLGDNKEYYFAVRSEAIINKLYLEDIQRCKALTKKEKKYLSMLVDGYTQSELVKISGTTKSNISQIVKRIREKLNVYC